jgi:hypothetical protein
MLTSEFENMVARVAPLPTLPSRQVLMVQMLLQIPIPRSEKYL